MAELFTKCSLLSTNRDFLTGICLKDQFLFLLGTPHRCLSFVYMKQGFFSVPGYSGMCLQPLCKTYLEVQTKLHLCNLQ